MLSFNFNHRFIRDYRKIASPLTNLSYVNVSFNWSSEADKVFVKLKKLFSTAPVLIQPDCKQFMVEVDTSDVRVGAVLSQCSGNDNRLHPCRI